MEDGRWKIEEEKPLRPSTIHNPLSTIHYPLSEKWGQGKWVQGANLDKISLQPPRPKPV